jgi:hypothetical protein
MICFDLMLQLYEFFRARIDPGENSKSDDAYQDEQHRNRKKCRKQLVSTRVGTRATSPTKPLIIPRARALKAERELVNANETGKSSPRNISKISRSFTHKRLFSRTGVRANLRHQ